jgi:predicted  nucleic acid-binding Zn-ribbon protein
MPLELAYLRERRLNVLADRFERFGPKRASFDPVQLSATAASQSATTAMRAWEIYASSEEHAMKTYALALSLSIAIPFSLSAQSTAPSAQRNDLGEISDTLKRIESALKHQTEIQKADVLLRRVMFAAAQIATAEASLKKLDDESRTLRAENTDLESAMKRLETASESDAQRAQLSYAKNRMTTIQERLSTIEQERVSTANEIQALRRDSREWQAMLDKTLAMP